MPRLIRFGGARVRNAGIRADQVYDSLPDGLFLGELAFDEVGYIYRLVQNLRTTTYEGNPVGEDNTDGPWRVTRDESNQAFNSPAGVIVAVEVRSNQYCWIMVSGLIDVLKSASTGAVQRGHFIAIDDQADGRGETAGTSFNQRVFGVATRAEGSSATLIRDVRLRFLL